jgi:hypothetical protein
MLVQTVKSIFHRSQQSAQTFSKLVDSGFSMWTHLLAPPKVSIVVERIHEADLEVTHQKKDLMSLAPRK